MSEKTITKLLRRNQAAFRNPDKKYFYKAHFGERDDPPVDIWAGNSRIVGNVGGTNSTALISLITAGNI